MNDEEKKNTHNRAKKKMTKGWHFSPFKASLFLSVFACRRVCVCEYVDSKLV